MTRCGLRATLLLPILLLVGCGSCQQQAETEGGGGVSAEARHPQAGTGLQGRDDASEAKGRITMPATRPGREFPPTPEMVAPAAPPDEDLPVPEPPQEGDCVVIIDADPDFGEPPLTVSFSVEAHCSGTPTYTWDFGDGSPRSSEPAPTHVYGKAGEYVAALRAVAPDGTQASDEIDITVEESFLP